MKRRYVMLKFPPEKKTRTERGPVAAVASFTPGAEPAIKVDELEPRAAADLAQKRAFACIAPVMPMKLVEPLPANVDIAAAGAVAWGIRAVGADTSRFTGEGVVVAVLDTGIDHKHPAFNGIALERRNFTDGGPDDDHGHGTHCAGTIFGQNGANETRIGVARGVKTALIGKVLGPGGGGSDRIAEAVQWAVTNKANVISMSLGIDFPGYVKALETEGVPTQLATSLALEGYRANVLLFERLASLVAAQGAFMQTTLLVAAAGNESQRDVNPDFEIAVSPPAVADGFVSVAALAEAGASFSVAPFSNVGARVAGPGVNIISAKRGGGLVAMSGTSMATPHVAGVAALWAEKLRASGQLNGRLLQETLVAQASMAKLSGVAPRQVGAGLVQAPQS